MLEMMPQKKLFLDQMATFVKWAKKIDFHIPPYQLAESGKGKISRLSCCLAR